MMGAKVEMTNPAEALKWYRIAAEKGHGDSQFGLAKLYENGPHMFANDKSVPKDFIQAYKWFSLAAYNDGSGVPKVPDISETSLPIR